MIDRLVLDLDGCLADFTEAFTRLVSLDGIANANDRHWTCWDYPISVWGMPKKMFRQYMDAFARDGHYRNLRLLEPDASVLLGRLPKSVQVIVLTNRPPSTYADTESWLRIHGMDRYVDELIVTSRPKVDVLPSWENTLIWEDNLDNVRSFVDVGAKVIMRPQPWNVSHYTNLGLLGDVVQEVRAWS